MVRRVRPDRAAAEAATSHYEVDEAKRTVAVTEEGVEFVEDQLGIDNLYEAVNTPLVGYLNNALKAKELFHTRPGVHRHATARCSSSTSSPAACWPAAATTRACTRPSRPRRRWRSRTRTRPSPRSPCRTTSGSTRSSSGMTGTAQTEAAELHQTYKLGVVPIPTNRPMVREDRSDVIYKTEKAKFDAVVEDIAERHEAGQPVLVGTASVEKSEVLSKLLLQARHPARGAERQAPRPRGADRRAGRPAGRGHGRHQHGRPRHRHPCSAATRSSSPTSELRAPRAVAGRDAGGVRGGLGRRAAPRQGAGAGRARGGRRRPAGSTCSAPSGTSPGASTTSCAAGPAGRATRASRGSTCRWATT